MINSIPDIIKSKYFQLYLTENFSKIKTWIENKENEELVKVKQKETEVKIMEVTQINKEVMGELYPQISSSLWKFISVEIKESDKTFSIHRTLDSSEYIVIKSSTPLNLDLEIKDKRKYNWVDIVTVKNGVITFLNKFITY